MSTHEEEETEVGSGLTPPTITTTATSLREEEIMLIVKNEVKSGLEQVMEAFLLKLQPMEKAVQRLALDAAERELRETEAETLLREKEKAAAVTGAATTSGARTKPLGGGDPPRPTSELSRLLKGLLGEEEDEGSSGGGEEDEEDGEKRKDGKGNKKGGGREEIRAAVQPKRGLFSADNIWEVGRCRASTEGGRSKR